MLVFGSKYWYLRGKLMFGRECLCLGENIGVWKGWCLGMLVVSKGFQCSEKNVGVWECWWLARNVSALKGKLLSNRECWCLTGNESVY